MPFTYNKNFGTRHDLVEEDSEHTKCGAMLV